MRRWDQEREDNSGDSAECTHTQTRSGYTPPPKNQLGSRVDTSTWVLQGSGYHAGTFRVQLAFHECFGLSLFLLYLPPCPHELQASMNTWQKSVRFESRDGLQINLATVFFAFKPLSLIPPPVRVARTRGDQGLHVTAIFPLGHLGTTREIKKAH